MKRKSIIIYGSHYGTTEQYAKELAKRTKIEAISFTHVKDINHYDNIIYCGGLYAGGVLGMSKIFKKIKHITTKKIILVTVGLADPKDKKNRNNIRNHIKAQVVKEIYEKASIFHLRGGIDYQKLNVVHKTMLKLLYHSIKKIPEEKLTAEDKAMIETYNKKVNFIRFSDLNQIVNEIQS